MPLDAAVEAGDLLPSLPETVWVGMSAGSMVMTPRIGADLVQWPSAPTDKTLGVIDDQTAIMLADGTTEVVSEGRWKLLTWPTVLSGTARINPSRDRRGDPPGRGRP